MNVKVYFVTVYISSAYLLTTDIAGGKRLNSSMCRSPLFSYIQYMTTCTTKQFELFSASKNEFITNFLCHSTETENDDFLRPG